MGLLPFRECFVEIKKIGKHVKTSYRRPDSNEAGVPAFRECLVEIRVFSDLSNRQAPFYVRSVCPIEQVNGAGR